MADVKPQELDPALVERAVSAALDTFVEMESWTELFPFDEVVSAALLSLGIPAAALNALAKGGAVVVPKELSEAQIDAMLCTANTHFNSPLRGRARVLAKYRQRHTAMLATSPYRSDT